MKIVIQDIFSKQILIIRKNNLIFIRIYHFYQTERKIRALKDALNHGLVLKKVHRVIKFNHRAWLKLYIDINTKKGMEAKNEFEKIFFKLMINSGFGKTMENLRKQLVATDEKRKLTSEPNY